MIKIKIWQLAIENLVFFHLFLQLITSFIPSFIPEEEGLENLILTK